MRLGGAEGEHAEGGAGAGAGGEEGCPFWAEGEGAGGAGVDEGGGAGRGEGGVGGGPGEGVWGGVGFEGGGGGWFLAFGGLVGGGICEFALWGEGRGGEEGVAVRCCRCRCRCRGGTLRGKAG